MSFDLSYVVSTFPKIASAIPTTLYLTVVSMFFAVLLGLLIAIIRLNNVPILATIAKYWILFVRSVPLMVILYIAYYALPLMMSRIMANMGKQFNWNALPSTLFAVTALTLIYSAYLSECFRGSILAVNKGQMEAARSIGMTGLSAYFHVVLPQAFAIALPNIGNLFICLLKDTSLSYLVMVQDVLGMAKSIGGVDYTFIECYFVAALIYWAISSIFELLLKIIDKKVFHFKAIRVQ